MHSKLTIYEVDVGRLLFVTYDPVLRHCTISFFVVLDFAWSINFFWKYGFQVGAVTAKLQQFE